MPDERRPKPTGKATIAPDGSINVNVTMEQPQKGARMFPPDIVPPERTDAEKALEYFGLADEQVFHFPDGQPAIKFVSREEFAVSLKVPEPKDGPRVKIITTNGRKCYYVPGVKMQCYWCGFDEKGNATGKRVDGWIDFGRCDMMFHPQYQRVCPECGHDILHGNADIADLVKAKDAALDRHAILAAIKRQRKPGESPAARREKP